MDNLMSYYGLIFFDPELRQGLAAHNAELVRRRAEAASVGSRPEHWFVKALQSVAHRVGPTLRLRKERQAFL